MQLILDLDAINIAFYVGVINGMYFAWQDTQVDLINLQLLFQPARTA